MWSDESRFTLFQSDGCIRVRREADEVMHTSCIVTTLPSSTQDLGKKLMQLWTGINVVTLQKFIETMPRRMRA